jgi:hypothetical protein
MDMDVKITSWDLPEKEWKKTEKEWVMPKTVPTILQCFGRIIVICKSYNFVYKPLYFDPILFYFSTPVLVPGICLAWCRLTGFYPI